MSKSRVGLSYSLGDSDDLGNHILPVNCLTVAGHSLVTGGRDGCVKRWTMGAPGAAHSGTAVPPPPLTPYDDDLDTELLRLEQAVSGCPLPHGRWQPPGLTVESSYPVHFDWVNDVHAVSDQAIVSCSSDLSMKIVGASGAVHKFANAHTDYIKRLAAPVGASYVVSGGLDGRLIEWDVETLRPRAQLNNCTTTSTARTSVYSLAANGHLVAAGGPSTTINLFDPRLPPSSAFLRKLIGHSDNVRALLMNDTYVVSGSSDTMVRIWDLRTFKSFRSLDVHDQPVWSLTSAEPGNFSTLYTGDKGGRIVKTDLTQWRSHQMRVPPEFATFSPSALDEEVGVSVVVAEDPWPVLALCPTARGVFSSSPHGLAQYVDPELAQISRYQYLRAGDRLLVGDCADAEEAGQGEGDVNSEFYDLISHLSMDSGPVDAQSLFSGLAGPSEWHPSEAGVDESVGSEDGGFSMFLDPNGGPSAMFLNEGGDLDGPDPPQGAESYDPNTVYQVAGIKGANGELLNPAQVAQGQQRTANPFADPSAPPLDPSTVEIGLAPVQNVCVIPYNQRPAWALAIVPRAIIGKRLLNNKRQSLVLYQNGDIVLWDLMTCQPSATKWPSPVHGRALTDKEAETRVKDLEAIFHDLQTQDALGNWCEVEIKAGRLFVSIRETSFANVEMFYDELTRAYPFLALDTPENSWLAQERHVVANADDRYTLGLVLLNSLFHSYAVYEWGFDRTVREELRTMKTTQSPAPSSPESGLKKFKVFGKRKNQEEDSPRPDVASTISISSVSSFLNDNAPPKTPHGDDSVYMLLQTNKKIYWEQYQRSTYKPGTLVDSVLRVDQIDPRYRDPACEDTINYNPIIDSRTRLPANLSVMIFEYSSELGNYRDLRRFTMDEINSGDATEDLRLYLPRWIGRPILYNKLPPREVPKLAFCLTEVDYEKLHPDQKIGGKSQKKIKKLPLLDQQIKLTSHNMLRASKIMQYLTEKLDSKTSEMKSGKAPTEWLALECRGVEIDPSMTLQTIKTRIWKSSSEIELHFRRQFDSGEKPMLSW
ncbi:hypothetical protein DICA4_E06678 [Diutina catenulata]